MTGVTVVDVDALDRWIREFAAPVAANKDLLTRLDSAIGDADHGANMDRGMTAVVAALRRVLARPAPRRCSSRSG